MRKVLLLVAPVCYKTVAEDMIGCANKGIGMMHLHVRNEKGEQTAFALIPYLWP